MHGKHGLIRAALKAVDTHSAAVHIFNRLYVAPAKLLRQGASQVAFCAVFGKVFAVNKAACAVVFNLNPALCLFYECHGLARLQNAQYAGA